MIIFSLAFSVPPYLILLDLCTIGSILCVCARFFSLSSLIRFELFSCNCIVSFNFCHIKYPKQFDFVLFLTLTSVVPIDLRYGMFIMQFILTFNFHTILMSSSFVEFQIDFSAFKVFMITINGRVPVNRKKNNKPTDRFQWSDVLCLPIRFMLK